ncbi:hypothetical protein P43SY_004963 [Pythium insidiosum]|uniref:1-phosphatidylinositol 4-kinase n=1 Tax=Pythium insidiosum TaxID=114742 RepID=A0AAD5Q7L8_PYTIN|nr:hypothetical protein P43SY_004963 [Pythium insidiosum]
MMALETTAAASETPLWPKTLLQDAADVVVEDEPPLSTMTATTAASASSSLTSSLSDDNEEASARADEQRAATGLSMVLALPRRVRESVFVRRPRKTPAAARDHAVDEIDHLADAVVPVDNEDDDDEEEEDQAETHDRERHDSDASQLPLPLASPSPSPSLSPSSGFAFPNFASIASLTRTLSQRSDLSAKAEEPSESFKSFWDEKLRHTMDKLAHRSKAETGADAFEQISSELDVFHVVLKLYAHQDVIGELYATYERSPTEFEFYIPQLCTFLLHGNYAKRHQLECFLMSRSGESLMFAHRLRWFLQAFGDGARGYQSEYLSVTSSQDDENADLLTAIQQRGGVPAVLMEQGLNKEEVIEARSNLRLRRASVFDIDEASQLAGAKVLEGDDGAFVDYLQSKREVMMNEARPTEGNDEQATLYNATPDFVRSLTDLADRLIPTPLAQRNEELRRGLTEIHTSVLPSNVIYLPIGNPCHRVKAIQMYESFTFSTKERVPYFLCVEVIDYSTGHSGVVVRSRRKSLSSRRPPRSRFGGIKLRFKKNRVQHLHVGQESPQTTETKPRKSSKRSRCNSRDSLGGSGAVRTPDIGSDNDRVSTPQPAALKDSSRARLSSDDLGPDPFAMVPDPFSVSHDVQSDARDEPLNCVESPRNDPRPSDQSQAMGQWGLPRVRLGAGSATPQRATIFDSIYSSLFTAKTKQQPDAAALSPAPAGPLTENAIPTPTVEVVALTPDLNPEVRRSAEETNETLVREPSTDDKACKVDETKPRRGRDVSVSLDFTDPDAWKVNFELEDALTDAEPEAEVAGAQESAEPAEHEVESDDEDAEDKPIIVFRERWSEKEDRIRKTSPFGDHPGWRLLPVIVKSNDDLRQEQFAAQLIAQCDRIFRAYSLPLRLRPYNVIATSTKAGLIEAVPDTVSLDSLKRNDPEYTTLLDFYHRLFGPSDSFTFRQARRNFVESLAAYSILCYVFQIKDRHNGNILVDTEGHIIHIDFGFLLTNSPGSNLNFERAPFKLTDEFVGLMGGPRSATFRYFRSLCIRAYLALRRNMDKIVLPVEMMLVGNADLPCFAGGKRAVVEGLRERLKPGARTSECQTFVNHLIDRSINNWRTRWYDKYQRACLGIL